MTSPISFTFGLFALWITSKVFRQYGAYRRIADIPSIGPAGFLGSYLSLLRYLSDAKGVIAEGYDRYPRGAFRFATLKEWVVVVTDPALTSELARAPDDVLSLQAALNETFGFHDTLGRHCAEDPYQAVVVRTALTKNIAPRFNDIRDEIVHATSDHFPVAKGEWTELVAADALRHVICRASNRFFVGLPLCRDTDFIDLVIEWTVDVFKTGLVLTCFPPVFRPYIKKLIGSKVDTNIARGIKHLGPLLEKAIADETLYGKDWAERPNDLIHWLLPHANTPERRNIHNLSNTLMSVNFAAIHTTSNTLINAVYDLAVHPELLQPLREEAEAIIELEGWTKDAMDKLNKIDSFLKESARLTGVGALALKRLAVKGYMFSDGTVIPQGTYVATAASATHLDPTHYPQRDALDAFVWSSIREVGGASSTKERMTSTKNNYQLFGHGRHACPGRFYAVTVMKAVLVHLILKYDFKIVNGERPRTKWFLELMQPDCTAKLLFRARRDA